MTLPDQPTDRSGRVKEYAKMAVRAQLHKRNLDLVRNPFPVRLVTTMRWLEVDTVLDIGANVGQYASSLRGSGFDGRIISCEPLSDAFAHLARRSSSDARWTTLRTAVGAEEGTLQINVSANSYSSSLLTMTAAHVDAAPGSETVGAEDVAVTTVADIVESQSVDPARTLLKIDTQGYEASVLKGAGDLVGRFAAVQLEMSFVPLYDGQPMFDELDELLKAAGLGVYAFEAGFSDPRTGRMLQCDGLYVRTDLMSRDVADGS